MGVQVGGESVKGGGGRGICKDEVEGDWGWKGDRQGVRVGGGSVSGGVGSGISKGWKVNLQE